MSLDVQILSIAIVFITLGYMIKIIKSKTSGQNNGEVLHI